MFTNYLKTAFRQIGKSKVFSTINIMGLALGLTCSILIMLWVVDEYKVDRIHKNGQQLYSVYEKQFRDGEVSAFHGTPGVMAEEMKKILPEVQLASNYAWNELSTFEANGKINKLEGNHAGPDFFKLFSYDIIAGNRNTALSSPSGIAISEKMAKQFFGSPAAAMGKTIRFQNREDFTISTVFRIPPHSSEQFDYILSWEHFLKGNGWARDWTNNGPRCFIMLRKGTNVAAFTKKISRFLDAYNKEQTAHSFIRLGIQRYGDTYLRSNFDRNGNISGGRIQYVRLFSMVAVFILLIACINFMNLTTARSLKRAREIGVRKVMGALRASLIRQFLGEALLIAFMAIGIALLATRLILPAFNQLTGKQIAFPVQDPVFWLSIFSLLGLTGVLSGSYPALYLSSFRPIVVLKGTLQFPKIALWFRKGLVVFQFILSIVLIVGTIVIGRQIHFIQKMNLGYDRENLLYLPLEGELFAKYSLFKNRALEMPGIQTVSRMTDFPTKIENGTGGVEWAGKNADLDIQFTQSAVGYDFVKTMRLQMVKGRDFSKEFATDSVGYLLNETALKIVGYKDPIGQPLTFWGKKGTIIGIVKDFHFNSVHTAINPLVLRNGENLGWGLALVRTKPGQTKSALASLEKLCRELNPKFPFTYQFSDLEYQKLYKSEEVVGQLAYYFSFLAIFISCLGLLGLVMYTAEQRTKEFGIRKVLGASVASLFGLLSREFLMLVFIAMSIAAPLAWLAMHKWLQNYEYRISISWWMFAMAGLTAMMIALVTISFQAMKAAVANPVKSLRTE